MAIGPRLFEKSVYRLCRIVDSLDPSMLSERVAGSECASMLERESEFGYFILQSQLNMFLQVDPKDRVIGPLLLKDAYLQPLLEKRTQFFDNRNPNPFFMYDKVIRGADIIKTKSDVPTTSSESRSRCVTKLEVKSRIASEFGVVV